MKILSRFYLLVAGLLIGTGLMAQSQSVTLQISENGRQGQTLIDTTFVIPADTDIDSVLDVIRASQLLEDDNLNTVVIIRDTGKPADEAEERPTPSSGPRAMIGVYMDTDDSRKKGVRVSKIMAGSGAEDADIQVGDMIVAVAGKKVSSVHDVGEAKQSFQIGDDIEVDLVRNGQSETVVVELRGADVLRQKENEQKARYSHKERGFMGVYPDEISADRARELGLGSQQGVYLDKVISGSGAERGGLRKGDVLTAIDGRTLDAAYELSDALRGHAPGDTIDVDYWRNGQSEATTIVLTERVREKPTPRIRVQVERAYLGVHLEDDDDDDAPSGTLITGIVEGKPAEGAGLQEDDYILSIDGRETPDYHTLSEIMGELAPGQRVKIRYWRNGEKQTVSVKLGSRTVHRWVNMPPEAEMPPEDLVKQVEDPDQASQLRSFMEDPSLEMERFELFPNPSNGRFTLRFEMAEAGDTDVRVFTVKGDEIYRDRLRNFSGNYDRAIDLRDKTAKGVYFLQITRNGKGMVERLLITE